MGVQPFNSCNGAAVAQLLRLRCLFTQNCARAAKNTGLLKKMETRKACSSEKDSDTHAISSHSPSLMRARAHTHTFAHTKSHLPAFREIKARTEAHLQTRRTKCTSPFLPSPFSSIILSTHLAHSFIFGR